jgi:hypothetical protein
MSIPRNNKWIIIKRKKYSLNYFLARTVHSLQVQVCKQCTKIIDAWLSDKSFYEPDMIKG